MQKMRRANTKPCTFRSKRMLWLNALSIEHVGTLCLFVHKKQSLVVYNSTLMAIVCVVNSEHFFIFLFFLLLNISIILFCLYLLGYVPFPCDAWRSLSLSLSFTHYFFLNFLLLFRVFIFDHQWPPLDIIYSLQFESMICANVLIHCSCFVVKTPYQRLFYYFSFAYLLIITWFNERTKYFLCM